MARRRTGAAPGVQGAGDVGHREGAERAERPERRGLDVGVGVVAAPAPPDLDVGRRDRLRSPGAGGGLRRGSAAGSVAGSSLTNSSMADITTNTAGEAELIPPRRAPARPGERPPPALAPRPHS